VISVDEAVAAPYPWTRDGTRPLKSSARDFAAEEAALRAGLDGERWKAVYALRALEDEWARHIVGGASGALVAALRRAYELGLEPGLALEAAEHLARAETWQAEIASWATSGAEGLAAMAEVHELKLARAWLLFVSGADRSRARVRQLCAELERDPNGVAARLRPHLAALKAELR
jgi:hypothetical protein